MVILNLPQCKNEYVQEIARLKFLQENTRNVDKFTLLHHADFLAWIRTMIVLGKNGQKQHGEIVEKFCRDYLPKDKQISRDVLYLLCMYNRIVYVADLWKHSIEKKERFCECPFREFCMLDNVKCLKDVYGEFRAKITRNILKEGIKNALELYRWKNIDIILKKHPDLKIDQDLQKDPKFLIAIGIWEVLGLYKPLQNNRKLLLKAVEKNGNALEFASDTLKKDVPIVSKAVKQNGRSLQYADLSLRKRKDFLLKAVKEDGSSLQFADRLLRKDETVVLAATKVNKYPLSENLKSFSKVKRVLLVKQNALALQYADESLQKDLDFLARVRKQGSLITDQNISESKAIISAVQSLQWDKMYSYFLKFPKLQRDKRILRKVENQRKVAMQRYFSSLYFERKIDRLRSFTKDIHGDISQIARNLCPNSLFADKDGNIQFYPIFSDSRYIDPKINPYHYMFSIAYSLIKIILALFFRQSPQDSLVITRKELGILKKVFFESKLFPFASVVIEENYKDGEFKRDWDYNDGEIEGKLDLTDHDNDVSNNLELLLHCNQQTSQDTTPLFDPAASNGEDGNGNGDDEEDGEDKDTEEEDGEDEDTRRDEDFRDHDNRDHDRRDGDGNSGIVHSDDTEDSFTTTISQITPTNATDSFTTTILSQRTPTNSTRSTILRFYRWRESMKQAKYKLRQKIHDSSPVTVAFFGPAGSGKTSTINTICATMNLKRMKTIESTMNPGIATKAARSFEIIAEDQAPICRIYDSVGISSDIYSKEEIKAFVHGQLIGVSYSPEKQSWINDWKTLQVSTPAHVVAITINHHELYSEDSVLHTKIRNMIELAITESFGIMVVITQIDQLCENEHFKDWYMNREFKMRIEDPLKQRVHQLFGINKGMIHCLMNYNGSDYSLDDNTTNRVLDILECARKSIAILPDKEPKETSFAIDKIKKAW